MLLGSHLTIRYGLLPHVTVKVFCIVDGRFMDVFKNSFMINSVDFEFFLLQMSTGVVFR